MATFTEENRTSSNLTADSRTAVISMTQDNRTFSVTQGKLKAAHLLPLFLTIATASGVFIPDNRTS